MFGTFQTAIWDWGNEGNDRCCAGGKGVDHDLRPWPSIIKKRSQCGDKRVIIKVIKNSATCQIILARSLVTRDSKSGLLVPEVMNPYYSAIVDIMTKLAEQKGYTLLLGISNSKSQNEKRMWETFIARRVLGDRC